MKVKQSCVDCLWKRQQRLSSDPSYLSEIRSILDNRRENDCAPYLVYLFNQAHQRHFGKRPSYSSINKECNDLVLSMEESLRQKIQSSSDPLRTAFVFARLGNYIDFGALSNVNKETFLSLFEDASMSEMDEQVFDCFLADCEKGGEMLLIADNCGEIVLDKLFIEKLREQFPQLSVSVMVRGGEVLNDAAEEHAVYVGLDRSARIISSGSLVSGTVYELLSEEAKTAFENADIVLAKGQGNYESLSGIGRRIYFSFLCKCPLFTEKFRVPELTGVFIREG